jgi:hypothetical protein
MTMTRLACMVFDPWFNFYLFHLGQLRHPKKIKLKIQRSSCILLIQRLYVARAVVWLFIWRDKLLRRKLYRIWTHLIGLCAE